MKAISPIRLHPFLGSLASEYDVLGPIVLTDGTLSFGPLSGEPFALLQGRVPFRIASLFFPHISRLLTISGDNRIEIPDSADKPLLTIGWNADDLDALEFTDNVFRSGFCDDLYDRIRATSVIIGVTGRDSRNGDFDRIAGGKCDLELIYDGRFFIIAPYTEKGNELAERMDGGEESASMEALVQESDAIQQPGKDLLHRASDLLIQEKVTDEFWTEIANRCIACTTCNNVCPTCTCFEVYDVRHKDKVDRVRQWDSCQLSGFMREASGHNPLGSQASRARRRIHHKLVADRQRWGAISCFLCGRCDDSCPTGIGIQSVAREIVERFG